MSTAWIKEHFAFAQDCHDIVQINKGYSFDSKYMLSHPDGQTDLLRLFDPEQLETKQAEFEIMGKLRTLGVTCASPLQFGTSAALGKGYMLVSYIAGQEATDVLPLCTDEEQYRIGREAGRELRKIHQLHGPSSMPSWYDRKLPKHRRYIQKYRDCGVRVRHDERIIAFIEDNVHLMKDRPNLFQHDDFHPGNIVLADKTFAGVIDFGRYDWGDPVHEFLKVGIFSSEISIPFSIGQIVGYHQQGAIDETFWRLYSLYLAMCVFSSVVWILQVKPEELHVMLDKIYRLLDDHQNFTVVRPRWFTEC